MWEMLLIVKKSEIRTICGRVKIYTLDGKGRHTLTVIKETDVV